MTRLIKDNITGSFLLPNSPGTINLGSYSSSAIQGLMGVGGNGFKLPPAPVPVATSKPSVVRSTPSLQNLTSTNNQQQPVATDPNIVSFTTALIQMLKEAQRRDQAGQANLMKQSQGIIGQGLNDATRNFNNPMLAPNSGTSLGMSAQNQFDPLTLSIANQQKLASQNLGNITDVIKQTSSDYNNEQDRLLRIEEKKQDAIEKAKDRSSNTGGYTPQELRKLRAAGIDSTDLETSDRFLYAGGGANINDDVISPYYDRIATSMLDMIGSDLTFKNLGELYSYLDKTPTVTINSKKVTLNPEQVVSLKNEIQNQRTFFQKLIPGGK